MSLAAFMEKVGYLWIANNRGQSLRLVCLLSGQLQGEVCLYRLPSRKNTLGT